MKYTWCAYLSPPSYLSVLSVWEWQQLMSTPKKYHFKNKKLKNPNNKNSFIDVLESDH